MNGDAGRQADRQACWLAQTEEQAQRGGRAGPDGMGHRAKNETEYVYRVRASLSPATAGPLQQKSPLRLAVLKCLPVAFAGDTLFE